MHSSLIAGVHVRWLREGETGILALLGAPVHRGALTPLQTPNLLDAIETVISGALSTALGPVLQGLQHSDTSSTRRPLETSNRCVPRMRRYA